MMELIDEADFGAPDPRPRHIGQVGGRRGVDIDFAGVGMFEQARNVQKRRFAGAGRSDQRHRLAGPYRELGAAQHVERRIALAELPADAVQEDERLLVIVGYRRGGPGYRGGVIHRARSFIAQRFDRIEPGRAP